MNLGFDKFYERDVRPLIHEISGILAGAGWSTINAYEKLGRVVATLAIVTALMWMFLLMAITAISVPVDTWNIYKCFRDPACTIQVRPEP